jgi:hypothetical protein
MVATVIVIFNSAASHNLTYIFNLDETLVAFKKNRDHLLSEMADYVSCF